MTPRSARPLATATCPSHSRSPATPPRSRRHPMRSRGTRGVAPRPPRTASACRRWDQVPAGLAFVPSLSKGTTHLQHLLAVESGPIEVPRHESHHRRGHHTHADGHRFLVLLCEGLELPLQGRGRLQVAAMAGQGDREPEQRFPPEPPVFGAPGQVQCLSIVRLGRVQVALPVADPGQADETLDPSLTRSPPSRWRGGPPATDGLRLGAPGIARTATSLRPSGDPGRSLPPPGPTRGLPAGWPALPPVVAATRPVWPWRAPIRLAPRGSSRSPRVADGSSFPRRPREVARGRTRGSSPAWRSGIGRLPRVARGGSPPRARRSLPGRPRPAPPRPQPRRHRG